MQRGNDRCRVFYADEQRSCYLSFLTHSSRKYQCAIHAYVLMDNHVHILASHAIDGGLSRMMQWLGARYTASFNESQGRTGTLWEGRFHSSAVTSERYFLLCQRYIELNPVRAGLVADAAEFSWSSYAHNALGRPSRLLTEHEIYRNLGSTRQSQCESYRALFGAPLPDADLAAIRAAIGRRRALGDPPDVPREARRGRPRKQEREMDPVDGQLEIRL